MFKAADLVLVTKADLLPYVPQVRVEVIAESLARVMPRPRFILLSALTGAGMEEWLSWLEAAREMMRAGRPAAPAAAS
jgi:hydrogenase nickel incorporation protein HypB